MSIIRKVNGKPQVIAEKSVIDHNQLANRDQYGAHSIASIRKLPEKLTALKQKDEEINQNIEQINARIATNTINIANNAEKIKFNMTDLCDGIAYEYGVNNNSLTPARNFNRDILSTCKKIAAKYYSNSEHTSYVEKTALKIFDGISSVSGLTQRDRLLLQAAVRMHDCGTFVSFHDIEENSAGIILSSEILGVSELEKHTIAEIVRYTLSDFPSFNAINELISEEEYIKVAKPIITLSYLGCL